MATTLQVSTTPEGVLRVAIEGDLDSGTTRDLRDQLQALLTRKPRLLEVDLSQLHTIDSSGVGMLVSLYKGVRSHGGQGQTFVSTTRPGITRGEHFHLGKVERFVVLSGSATIALRRLFTDEVVSFDVSGDRPCVVDMPTMWVHNITNTGDDELTTLFWTHSLFDPDAPDTYWEPVAHTEKVAP